MFVSPWAQSREDEAYFCRTLDTLGAIVRDDVKLGTLYLLLVLATPGRAAPPQLRADPTLAAAQYELRLLLYRYLKHKHLQLPDTADLQYNSLLRLVSELEICKDIHVFGRIHKPPQNTDADTIYLTPTYINL